MSILTDDSGRRSVEVVTEVPGAPEDVWRAIATGPGVSAWFVPTDVEHGFDGVPVSMVSHFGPNMDSIADIREWSPPHRFRAESHDLGEGAPVITTVWSVESRSKGTCAVKVVHSLAADDDAWDSHLTSWAAGWPDFFRILQLYLGHFEGKRCSGFSLMGLSEGSQQKAWETLAEPLGLLSAALEERCKSEPDAPVLAGVVEATEEASSEAFQVLLRLDEPGPGIAHLFAMPIEDRFCLSVRLYFYGDQAAALVSREEPRWQSWLSNLFPDS